MRIVRVIVIAITVVGLFVRTASAQGASREELLARVAALEIQIAELKALIEQKPVEEGYLHDLKFGAVLDTYYGFNFNRPLARVNLLPAYDITTNSLSVSQATFT